MLPLLPLLAGSIVASMALLFARRRRRRRMVAWREAAHAAALTDVSERTEFFDPSVEGRAGELRVRLQGYRRGRSERGTRFEIRLGTGSAAFSVRREGVGTALGKRFAGAQEVEIGDAVFDRECFVEMPAAMALAVLDRPTRRALSALLGGYATIRGSEREVRASVESGLLRVDLRETPFSEPAHLVADLLPALLDLAHRLVPPPDPAARLAENFASEPETGVRLQIVLTLAREFPNDPATRSALTAACSDASDEVRLRAAMALGADGRETLLALVSQPRADDSCRARAVRALGAALDRPLLEATLRQARSGGAVLTACACLEALAGLADGSEEAILIDALSDPAPAVALAAARGLARTGTVAAVAPLLELESAGRELRGAARQAIAEVQARLKGASPGQLSLAAGEAGTLSLADGEPGRLSLSEGLPAGTPAEGPEEAIAPRPRERTRSTQ